MTARDTNNRSVGPAVDEPRQPTNNRRVGPAADKPRRPTMLQFAILTIFLILSPAASAHDGPEEVLASLNAAILRNGPTADLLFRRACEFRAMRDYKHAAADLRYAVRLDSSMEIARLELSKLQLQLLKSTPVSERGTSAFGERRFAIINRIIYERVPGQTIVLGLIVIPAQAGIQSSTVWIPACAGMTHSLF